MRMCDFTLFSILLQISFVTIVARTANESVASIGALAKPHPKGKSRRVI